VRNIRSKIERRLVRKCTGAELSTVWVSPIVATHAMEIDRARLDWQYEHRLALRVWRGWGTDPDGSATGKVRLQCETSVQGQVEILQELGRDVVEVAELE
jgi:hypothetical protein